MVLLKYNKILDENSVLVVLVIFEVQVEVEEENEEMHLKAILSNESIITN